MLYHEYSLKEGFLTEYFKHKEVKREYIALLCGNFPHDTALIDAPIGRDPKERKKMAVIATNAKEAITHLKVIKRYKNYTLVRLRLETGRTHQIRVHMSEIGYPIVGDYIYSNGKNPFNVEGQMLHARQIEFVHPTTGKDMKIEAPIPKYFQNIINEMCEVRV